MSLSKDQGCSLTETPDSLQRETAEGLALEGILGTEAPEDALVERIALREAVNQLPEKERMTILLRYFNPIGSHPTAIIGEMPNGVPMNLIPYVTQTAMGIREQLKIFGNDYDTPDGTCIRDYIYVVDLAKAHVKAMERVLDTDSDKLEVFNIGTGKGVSTKEIVDAFEKATGVKLNWTFAPRRPGDIEKVWANPDKANNVLGWKAETSLEDTLKSAWNWQKKLREEGIQ